MTATTLRGVNPPAAITGRRKGRSRQRAERMGDAAARGGSVHENRVNRRFVKVHELGRAHSERLDDEESPLRELRSEAIGQFPVHLDRIHADAASQRRQGRGVGRVHDTDAQETPAHPVGDSPRRFGVDVAFRGRQDHAQRVGAGPRDHVGVRHGRDTRRS